MKEFYGYFNSVEGDVREYIDKELAEVFKAGFTNGVEDENALKVEAVPARMQVSVSFGRAIIEGFVYSLLDDGGKIKLLDISPAGSAPRVDRVLLRLDYKKRNIELLVVEGLQGSNPKPKDPIRKGDIYDLVLADIRVEPARAEIGNIYDTRSDETLCGYITASGLKRSILEGLEKKITGNKSATDEKIKGISHIAEENSKSIKQNKDDIESLRKGTENYIEKADVISFEIEDRNDGANTWTNDTNDVWYKDYPAQVSKNDKVIVGFSANATNGLELKKCTKFISSFYDTQILDGKIRVYRNATIINGDNAKIKPFKINAVVIK